MEEMNKVEELLEVATTVTDDGSSITQEISLPEVSTEKSGSAGKIAIGVGAGVLAVSAIAYGAVKLVKRFRKKRAEKEYFEDDFEDEELEEVDPEDIDDREEDPETEEASE